MELAVLVPVLNRPANIAPLVESFLENCPADSYLDFILSADDAAELEAVQTVSDWERIGWHDSGLSTTWPARINFGVFENDADWFLCAADDITFTPGWWEATHDLRHDGVTQVIGTNDSATGAGNPWVAKGHHTCHPLIAMQYIRDRGTVDQKGLAVHPGYHHWYVDNELVETAKARRVWAYCQEAVLEHNHPYWRDGQGWDATYALGESRAKEDEQVWLSRMGLIRAEADRCRT